ncbi:translation initiation factor eIF-2B subunit epsilon-like [Ctenocephalides felis]|uniref:translation initiation factor eIF-2B subunit epsilon-like n=1 Tax=Ctenocephalides felis TaxID=7515 RepID=UPI000E6E45E8|nr:translation initiation factor eIF-2B subunit epsilon-like [Ctenocephalides felis]
MSNKNAKKNLVESVQQEDVLQAVVLADNFSRNLAPLTDEMPLALVPIVNVPLLDYTLEALSLSGIQEVFLFCSTHIKKIKDFISSSIESRHSWSLTLSIQIVSSDGCRSFGDAIRDLDAKGLLRSNFVLLGANTVTNVNLSEVMEFHKQQCKKDKGAAMTLVYTTTGYGQSCSEDVILALDASNNRILYHQRPEKKQRNITLPLEVILDHPEVEMHHDVQDPGIAICSPVFLSLFTDNFDFQTRDDFIRGLLINEEILGSTLYCYPLTHNSYAARVDNWQMYQLVSHDIVNRWTYPLVPNMGISLFKQVYMMLKNNIYKSSTSVLGRSVNLKEDVVISENSQIQEQAYITNSIIGKNCRIGKRVKIMHSYLFDGTVVEDDCNVENSVIGFGSHLKTKSNVSSCVLGQKVVIPEKMFVEEKLVQCHDDDYEAEIRCTRLADKAFAISNLDLDSDSDDDDDKVEKKETKIILEKLRPSSPLSDYISSDDDDVSEAGKSPVPEDSNVFLSEVIDSLARGFDERLNCDYLILEINSSRYAYNMALSEVNYFVIRALFSLPQIQNSQEKLATTMEVLKYFTPVMLNYIKGTDAMNDCLKAIEDSCETHAFVKTGLSKIVHYLYDADVVSEDCIIAWNNLLDDDLQKLLSKLVEWLEEASEESEEESD